jgi:Domain of unknown function (DUF4291)
VAVCDVLLGNAATDRRCQPRSIQVGISRHLIAKYVEEWTVEIRDETPLVRKLYEMVNSGRTDRAQKLLPKETVYPLPPGLARRIGMLTRGAE